MTIKTFNKARKLRSQIKSTRLTLGWFDNFLFLRTSERLDAQYNTFYHYLKVKLEDLEAEFRSL